MTKMREVFPHIKPCYRSLQIKSLILSKEDTLFNVSTVFTFSTDEALNKVEDDSQHHPLHFITGSLDIIEWDVVQKQLCQGYFQLQAKTIKLNGGFDLGSRDGGIYRNGTEWPIFQAGTHQEVRSGHQDLDGGAERRELTAENVQLVQKLIKKFGYTDLSTFIQHQLGLRGHWQAATVHLSVPIYARIDEVRVDKEYHFICSVSHHRDLGKLKLAIDMHHRTEFGGIEDVAEHYAKDIPPKEEHARSHLDFPSIKQHIGNGNSIRIQLIHPELGEIIEYKFEQLDEVVLSSDVIRSPLFKATSLFFPKDALKERLASQQLSKNGRDQATIFEEAFTTLLSLGGIESVHLGQYDKIKDETGKDVAAADVLAFLRREGILLVISCKSAFPEKEILDKVINAATMVRNGLHEPVIKVVPVVAVAQPAADLKDRAKGYGVAVIDAPAIDELHKLVKLRPLRFSDLKPAEPPQPPLFK